MNEKGVEKKSRQADFFKSREKELAAFSRSFGYGWDGDVEFLIEWTQMLAKGDHADFLHDIVVSAEEELAAMEMLEAVDMLAEQQPPGGEYDQIIVLGGLMYINDLRSRFTKELLEREDDPVTLVEGGKLLFWGGPRKPLERERTLIYESLIDAFDTGDPWIEDKLAEPENGSVEDETAEGRLSLTRHFGKMAVIGAQMADDGFKLETTLFNENLERNVVLLSGRTVERRLLRGQPRPTTESCAREWIERHVLPEVGSQRVLFVASNPYIARMTLNIRRLLRENNVENIELVGCGPAAPPLPARVMLAEFARRLWEERAWTEVTNTSEATKAA